MSSPADARVGDRPPSAPADRPPAATRPRIVVFADDWGHHPSSAQHLTRHLLSRYRVDWVNTIGSRRPQLNLADLARGAGKMRQWMRGRTEPIPGLTLHDPWMLPSFRSARSRRANARLLARQLRAVLFEPPYPTAVITAHPLVADLARATPQLRWIYYCVDALDHWPGLDHDTLRDLEKELLATGCPIVTSSPELERHFASFGRQAHLLTHGVDLEMWRGATAPTPIQRARPRALFFGCIDRRVDVEICRALGQRMQLVLLGPIKDPDPELLRLPGVEHRPAVPFDQLPAAIARADVLVMPYARLAATQAMQPLKLKECLATSKPVVATSLPATRHWSAAMDVASAPDAFADIALRRAREPLPAEQAHARTALERESWAAKARRLESFFSTDTSVPVLNVRICCGMGSGPESMILPMPRATRASGFRERAAYVHNAGDPEVEALAAHAQRLGCPIHLVPERHMVDRHVVRQLEAICRDEGIRIWHGHDYKSNLFGLMLRRRLGLRLVTTVHGWVHHTWKTPAYHALDRWCLRRYDRVITVSRDLYDACLAIGVAPQRLHLIENACEDPGVAAAGHERPAGAPLTIGTLGRLSPEKGLDTLIQAVAALLAEGSNIELRIAGEGPERDCLARLAARSPHRDRIHFCGRVADANAFLSSLDVYAMPSLREGCPVALLEAMALGRPVLATGVGGVADVLADGAHGRVVPPANAAAIARELRLLVDDPALRRALGDAARRRYLERYTFAHRAQRVVEVYESLEP